MTDPRVPDLVAWLREHPGEALPAGLCDLRGLVLQGVNFYGADLYGADLRDADIRGANLYGTNLYGAIGIVGFGPVGTSRRIGYAVARVHSPPQVFLGSFAGTPDEAEAVIRLRYSGASADAYVGIVRAACAVLEAGE